MSIKDIELDFGIFIHGYVISLGGLAVVALLYALWIFYCEKERLAVKRTAALLFTLPIIIVLPFVLKIELLEIVEFIISIIIILLFFIYPSGKFKIDAIPVKQYDERDIMFSRKELGPESERYSAYYERNPQNEAKDLLFRKEPGLLSDNALFFNKKAFNAAREFFIEVDKLHPGVDGKVAGVRSAVEPANITEDLKEYAIRLGAKNVGFVGLKPYHFYSVKGRGNRYGQTINPKHKFAIAVTVEMDHDMVMPAPKASIVVESARQYLNSGNIAVELARYIRELGFGARAHIDGDYEVICPLVARDAGLGEIGRMGLLMTPKEGPRVRIAVVTTELELIPNNYVPDMSVWDFCYKCKKCAVCCPSQSIEHGRPTLKGEILRWKIDSESCFTYWCKVGTDCGRCMAVCPYSHPNNFFHNVVRWGIKNSAFVRQLAVWSDDYFYGRKPNSRPLSAKLL